jgi:hypothetical protein
VDELGESDDMTPMEVDAEHGVEKNCDSKIAGSGSGTGRACSGDGGDVSTGTTPDRIGGDRFESASLQLKSVRAAGGEAEDDEDEEAGRAL